MPPALRISKKTKDGEPDRNDSSLLYNLHTNDLCTALRAPLRVSRVTAQIIIADTACSVSDSSFYGYDNQREAEQDDRCIEHYTQNFEHVSLLAFLTTPLTRHLPMLGDDARVDPATAAPFGDHL